jgi:hypothetical protein
VVESYEEFESMRDLQSEIEAAVGAASGYVRASDDLRPRVLENARIARREWRVQLINRIAAVGIFVLAMSTTAFRAPSVSTVNPHSLIWIVRSSNSLFIPAQATALQGSELAWQLVDSFTDLRRRQADALNHSP